MFPQQEYIRERIARNGIDDVCSYSGKHEKVLPLSSIVDMVVSAFTEVFENPANEIPFESHGMWGGLEGTDLCQSIRVSTPNMRYWIGYDNYMAKEKYLNTENQPY